jgi:hypothetical protein
MNDNPMGLVCAAAILLGILALVITIWWRIFDKTGYGGGFALLMLIPFVNLIMLLVLAFGDWPVLQELRRLRRMEMDDREQLDSSGRFF